MATACWDNNGQVSQVDTVSAATRSAMMSKVRSKNTRPELAVRKIVWALGRRYRLHVADLPGKPDVVFPKDRKVIRVQGCYWHPHTPCKIARLPKSHRDYWLPKLKGNCERDERNLRLLLRAGWKVVTIRECQLRNPERVKDRLKAFLATPRMNS